TVYNVSTAALAAPINEVDTTSANNKTTYNGFDVTANARFGNGGVIFGGTSTRRTGAIARDVTDPNNTRYCDQSKLDIPLLTTAKVSGSYPLKYGVRVSAVFQSTPGDALATTYLVSATSFRTITGVTMGQSSVNLRLNKPGEEY